MPNKILHRLLNGDENDDARHENGVVQGDSSDFVISITLLLLFYVIFICAFICLRI